MLRVRSVVRTIAIMVACSMQPLIGYAESVSYLGETFPVDSLVPVHPDQVTVSIGGSSFMAPQKELGRRVAIAYAKDANLAKGLPWDRYLKFLGKIKIPEDREIVDASARMLLSSKLLQLEEQTELSRVIMQVDPTGAAVLEALQSTDSSAQGLPVCIAIRALDDSGRVAAKDKAAQVLLRHNAVCSQYLRKVGLRHVSEGAIEEAVCDLDVAISVFTLGPELDGSIVTARDRLTEVQKAAVSRDSFMYQKAFHAAAKDPFLSDALKQGRTVAVQHVADRLLHEGLPDDALSLLTLIDFQRRSESTHELVSEILAKLGRPEPTVFKQEGVQRLLIEFALKDEAIKERLLPLFDSAIREDISKGDLSLSLALFDAVREIRPDPSSENDQLRFAWAKRLLDQGQLPQAEKMIAGVSSAAPVLLRIRLLWKSNPSVLVAFSSVILFSVVGLMLFSKRRVLVERSQAAAHEGSVPEDEPEAEDEADEQERARFVRYSPDLRGGGIRDEYEDLLAVFRLSPGAKASHIKNAYRNAVKSCHPDLNRNASSAQADRFIYLTQSYERLLLLHAERTGER